jgi:hypothetical protein
MVKRNASKFYKTIAESMVLLVLGFDEQKQFTNENIDAKQIVFNTLSKYIDQQHDLELFVLNAKYDPSKKPVSVRDYFNSKHVEKSGGNKMVIDFIAKRDREGKEDLEPGRFYYYIIKHQESKISIGKKMRLISEFTDTDVIDILYYLKSLKDICASFFACTSKDAEKQIEEFYKEQTDSFKQTTLDFSPIEGVIEFNILIKRKNSEFCSKSKEQKLESVFKGSSSKAKSKITDYFHKK